MPIGLNEGNIGSNVCPGFGKSTYGASLTKTSETILETAALSEMGLLMGKFHQFLTELITHHTCVFLMNDNLSTHVSVFFLPNCYVH